MTNNDLVTLLENKLIKVSKNKIPNVPLYKIISHIKHNYNGVINFENSLLTINDEVFEIEGHHLEWNGRKSLKLI